MSPIEEVTVWHRDVISETVELVKLRIARDSRADLKNDRADALRAYDELGQLGKLNPLLTFLTVKYLRTFNRTSDWYDASDLRDMWSGWTERSDTHEAAWYTPVVRLHGDKVAHLAAPYIAEAASSLVSLTEIQVEDDPRKATHGAYVQPLKMLDSDAYGEYS